LRKRGEVEQAQDTELSILTEIRDLMSADGTTRPGSGSSPDSAKTTSAEKS
jgi:large conductance mechanosensitive channel